MLIIYTHIYNSKNWGPLNICLPCFISMSFCYSRATVRFFVSWYLFLFWIVSVKVFFFLNLLCFKYIALFCFQLFIIFLWMRFLWIKSVFNCFDIKHIYKFITFDENLHHFIYFKSLITVKIEIWSIKMSFSKAKLKRFNEITGNFLYSDSEYIDYIWSESDIVGRI